MKKILIVIAVILTFTLSACGIIAFAAGDDRQELETYIIEDLAPNGEIITILPFFGGDTKEDIFGYFVDVYDDYSCTRYCVYIEVETPRTDGRYTRDEIEIDADVYEKKIIW